MQTKLILGAAGFVVCLCGAVSGTNALADKTQFSDDGMAKNSKRDIDASVRNTRPAKDHHKDARKCLGGGGNEEIIKCAQKYR